MCNDENGDGMNYFKSSVFFWLLLMLGVLGANASVLATILACYIRKVTIRSLMTLLFGF